MVAGMSVPGTVRMACMRCGGTFDLEPGVLEEYQGNFGELPAHGPECPGLTRCDRCNDRTETDNGLCKRCARGRDESLERYFATMFGKATP